MEFDIRFFLAIVVLLGIGVIVAVERRNRERSAKEQRAKSEREAAPAQERPPPNPDGTFSAFELWPQAKYRVTTAFVDYDNVSHEVGERWTFVGKAFLPYEDGLSLFVEQDGQQVHIRLQCRDEAQGPVVRAFSDYVVEE